MNISLCKKKWHTKFFSLRVNQPLGGAKRQTKRKQHETNNSFKTYFFVSFVEDRFGLFEGELNADPVVA